ncbi:hypothetical protein [Bacillus subtilis]|uniref:hypothetical protein n=1 Tax=Bacillus subtilis TaxID=1423 RepID=UPI0010664D61|nr:hypothetical protein [Bacillus subtilis]TDY53728.1 hypothetical protein BJ795_3594 [Bacillus subtilis]
MTNAILKIDRSAVDEGIKNLDGMFNATNDVLNEYEEEKKSLEKRGEHLDRRLAELQEQHVTLLMDRETAKDNPSDYIYLSTQLKKIDEEVKILLSLQDQLKEEFKVLKEKYMPIIRETYSKDSLVRNNFNVNEAIASVRDELKQIISDYEKAINEQDQQVMDIIYEDFLDDSELMDESWNDPERRRKALAFKRTFDFDRNRIYYTSTINL